jgi:hypothetical protein
LGFSPSCRAGGTSAAQGLIAGNFISK